ncbi:hypothetical protein [Flavobacterium sp. LHD-85]|uniref:hypothetical protein n=1 Tax=Flavobacterium sp. LHD-85 TaxID=3071410 RepID=UPI0027DFE0A1|nr:hypothetical protein [Flavobacterium sp. LHD-85]MDQ6531946.1 hypothetical protein [Flavobacterium sp. LHD-85]
MQTGVKLQVRKELNGKQQLSIIKLKGSLISRGYTEIIHINDQDEDFHINSFETAVENRNEVHNFIKTFINQAELTDLVILLGNRINKGI